jgi:hypothetical protein
MKSQQIHNPNHASFVAATDCPDRIVQGTIQSVDILGREIAVLLPTGRDVFYVPPDCPTYLRGERIKLRIVKAHDKVRITYQKHCGLFVTKLLEIRPNTRRSCLGC